MAHDAAFPRKLQRDVMLFSFGWLAVANLVGLLLAGLLLFPQMGNVLGPVTYGRLMPLHMEWQLYGWCSLPLVGLLLKEFVREGAGAAESVRFALVAWSLGLLVGGIGFLSGQASGKLFLSWSGTSRCFFPIALLMVWGVLTMHWVRSRNTDALSRSRKIIQAVLLAVLATVPFMLYFSSSRSVYPPVNPQSGGATGHSLLASTLGLLGLIAAVPQLLGRARRASPVFAAFWVAYLLLWVVYLIIQHGNAVNSDWSQIAGLGSLLLIVPLLWIYMRLWSWPGASSGWVAAFLLWWTVLTVNGGVTFLPGVLDRLKFTNALVAHAHLAMAGMVTAFGFILLSSLHEENGRQERGVFGGCAAFLAWNGACLLMVAVLFLQGWREGGTPDVLFGRDGITSAVYATRFLAGAAMLMASIHWFMTSYWGKVGQ